MDRRRTCRLIIGVALAALQPWMESARAQPAPAAIEHIAPLTPDERSLVERITLADERIRSAVGAGQVRVITAQVELDKSEAEAFLAGTSSTPPTRRVTVFVLGAQTNKAVRALVAPAQNRVLAVEPLSASDVPFVRDDADQALALVKANAGVRSAVGADLDKFVVVDSGSDARVPFAAQILPLRSTAPNDPCTRDRCVDVLFRTENGYLGIRAHVDLTTRAVSVIRGGG
ncbi:MAG TPA: hypothetical protein VKB68_07435 [Stellaceae bacterium]|nr:hypothetical protein [Stellaceae bacterium]